MSVTEMAVRLQLGRPSILDWIRRDEDATLFSPPEERFEFIESIAAGGMGELFILFDRDLSRQVAVKLLRGDLTDDVATRLQFIAEAQATSQLDHPGIPPVHDIGLTDEGRLYFTMRLVKGRTLRRVLHHYASDDAAATRDTYTLHGLVTTLERVCETVHYGHERGVLHRDIKPENLILGDFGEVQVMDWGLARVKLASSGDRRGVQTTRAEVGIQTDMGWIIGTPVYMSPEQARGGVGGLDRRTDVYALGCVLYEMLRLECPFDPDDPDLLSRKIAGDFPDVAARGWDVPPELAAICRRAMATDPEDRLPTAKAMAQHLRAWLDGRSERNRREKEAEALAEQGRRAAEHYAETQSRLAAAEIAVEAEVLAHPSHVPIGNKKPLLEARKEAENLRVVTAVAFAKAVQHVEAALVRAPDNRAARSLYGRLWENRLAGAERRGDAAERAFALVMVGRFDGATRRRGGRFSIAVSHGPAEILLGDYTDHYGIRRLGRMRHVGTTPMHDLDLPEGSYLCELHREGYEPTKYPIHITRGRHWRCRVRLPRNQEVDPDAVYVAGGSFLAGEGNRASIEDVSDFAMMARPVTFAEYRAFLDALDEDEAKHRSPRAPSGTPYFAVQDGSPRLIPLVQGPARSRCIDEFGAEFEWDLAVVGVRFEDADAYCKWKSKSGSRRWRLPGTFEYEKAARGVDGRPFPWGSLEDASLCNCRGAHPDGSYPTPPGTRASATSVYGMMDAAGGVWEWTRSWADPARTLRVLKGGSWRSLPAEVRSAHRLALAPGVRSARIGFRCAYSF